MTLRRAERHRQQVAAHRDAAAHRHILAASALAAAWLAGCSHLPIDARGHADHDVVAEFVVPADGRLTVPASDAGLRVDDVAFAPAPAGEGFGVAGRWFRFAPGARVTARLRFRTFARDDAPPASAQATLPHATAVRPAADAP